jgi:hypothetical protein
MRELLDAVKADLTDRRLRPLVIVVAVALIGALAFVVLGGSSQSASPTATAAAVPGGAVATPALSQAAASNPKAAAAETTYGTHDQHGGKLVDPFTELPQPQSKTAAKKSASPAKGSSGSSGSGSGASSGGGSKPSSSGSGSGGSGSGGSGASPASPPPVPPAAPKTHVEYLADVELGPAPTTPGEAVHLTKYSRVKLGTALPTKSHPLVVLKAATFGGEKGTPPATATFALASSPIVNGPGKCLPSDTQCESVRLETTGLEELQYAEENGQTVTYLLRVTAVIKRIVTG